MSIQLYSPTSLDRVNPEFIGIAKRLSTSKQKRQSLQSERNKQLRTLKYKMSVDVQLSKDLDSHKEKLWEVKVASRRRQAETEFKKEQDQVKKANLRSLSMSVKESREDQKLSIKGALRHTFNKNQRSRLQEKKIHSLIEDQIRNKSQLQSLNNKKRYLMIKSGEKRGHKMVNKFFRTLNKDSLNVYQHQIQDQSQKAQHYEEDIRIMGSAIDKYDSVIEQKKDKLFGVFSQIEEYTLESALQQSKCLPLYLRPHNSVTSGSRRPKDLLLRGTGQLMDNSILSSNK